MAIKQIGRASVPAAEDHAMQAYGDRMDFVLDSAEDVANLPTCAPGSVAIVADKDGAVYMVNASGEWREQ